MIATAPAHDPLPREHLDAAVTALAEAGRRRLLVAVVETWAAEGSPPPHAVLRQVEALLAWGLTDRAWTRLQTVPTDGPHGPDRLRLEVRMFLARGWRDRAAEALDALRVLMPHEPSLPALHAALDDPPPAVPDGPPPRDIPRARALADLRACLATGATFRASQILDTLSRRDPTNEALTDLRWAIAGDYRLTTRALAVVVAEWSTGIPDDEAPATSEFDRPHDARRTPLPALFEPSRRPQPAADDGDPEATGKMQLDDILAAVSRIDGAVDANPEDTQVARVVHRGDARVANEITRGHRYGGGALESEDDGVVVMQRREGAVPPARTNLPLPAPSPDPRRRPPVQDDDDLPEISPDAISAPVSPGPPLWVLLAGGAGMALVGAAGMMILLALRG